MMDSKKQRRQHLFSNILKLMRTESFPDCRLVTKERIAVDAHKIILVQIPYLRNLLSAVSCCDGQGGTQEPVTILLPDFSFAHLEPVIHYLYTGVLKFPKSEKAVIRDLLLKTFRVPGERMHPTSRPGYVTCDECEEQMHLSKLFEHMLEKHVREPFLRDMQLAEEGRDVEGIEAFDETDAVNSVMKHYKDYLNKIVFNLKEEHDIEAQLDNTPELWLKKQREAQKQKQKPSEEDGSSLALSTAEPENGANQNKEKQKTSIEDCQVTDAVMNDSTPDDIVLERQAIKTMVDIRRRRSSRATERPKISHAPEASESTLDNSTEAISTSDVAHRQVLNSATNKLSSNDNSNTERGAVVEDKKRRRKSLTTSSKRHKIIHLENPDADTTQELDQPKKPKPNSKREIAHSERNKSSIRLSLKQKKKKDNDSSVPPQNNLKPGKVFCKECQTEWSRKTFRKHLVARHLFKLWPEIKEDETVCRKDDCKMVCESRKYLIQHMALKHNELEPKLQEIGKTLADYEGKREDEDKNDEKPTIDSYPRVLKFPKSSQDDDARGNDDIEKENESGSDVTMPLGFGDENRIEDFDD